MVTQKELEAEQKKVKAANERADAYHQQLIDTQKSFEERFEKLENRIKTLENQNNILNEENKQNKAIMEKEIENIKTSTTNNVWTTITKKNVKKTQEQISIINTIADEGKNRNKKETNIVIFGLKESSKESITEKKKEDDEKFLEIMKELKINITKIEASFRPPVKDKNKQRPLVIMLKTKEERNSVLKVARKLKGTVFDGVFICPDLTEAQRLQFKELLVLRKKLNDERTTEQIEAKIYYGIRDNKVVKITEKA